ncbi:MAG TPA: YtxH domain-containing protein [Clostridiaceae bacterium]|nr:YtxH domain-containing protein [Clostridiaceae bacterium]
MNSFRKGLIVGGLLGASIAMISNSDMMNGRNRKRMIKTGRTMMRRTGNIISDIVDVFR